MIYSRNVLGVHIFHKKKKISVSEKQVRKSTRGLIPRGEVAITRMFQSHVRYLTTTVASLSETYIYLPRETQIALVKIFIESCITK